VIRFKQFLGQISVFKIQIKAVFADGNTGACRSIAGQRFLLQEKVKYLLGNQSAPNKCSQQGA
jgi:hypothetical protein